MLELDEAAVVVVAAEARATVDAIDKAYVAHLRMSAEAIDGIQNSGLPMSQSAKLIRQLLDGQTAALTWRNHVQAAIATLQVIQKQSNQAEVNVGCPTPWFATASAKHGHKLEAD